ncbi:DMT family transporter [Blastopirellula sp. JC732]|uniref:DMT family transporter n=1 Tax=Blastopirellula sediminis TaxID=2894196 RepID=A0A9X1SHG7_9BACT|nr:DMT family transporter [Blastopirellula sediminis]MCC9608013.1 DMT family transporter [Blastopirellula sediminis]MCC9627194.1 DMT family transporter [Blastopirellula sediminis]
MTAWSILSASICALIWAGQAIAVKLSVVDLPPFFVITLRFLLALPLVAALACACGTSLRAARNQWFILAVSGVLVALQFSLFTIGTTYTTSARSIVLINTFPIFTALFCHLFLTHSQTNLRQRIGLGLAIAGVWVIFLHRAAEPGISLLGDILVLLSAASMAAKIVYVRVILQRLDPIQLVFWSTCIGMVICGLISFSSETVPATALTTSALTAVAYQGLLVSGVAVLLWTTLLKYHNPNELNIFRLTSPLLGVLGAWLFMADPLPPNLLLGCALVTAGLLSTTLRSGRAEENDEDVATSPTLFSELEENRPRNFPVSKNMGPDSVA